MTYEILPVCQQLRHLIFSKGGCGSFAQCIARLLVSTNWEGNHFCGLKLNWQYKDGYVNISIPGYINKVLHKSQHKPPLKSQDAPHTWTKPIYGQKRQFAVSDTEPVVGKEKQNLFNK